PTIAPASRLVSFSTDGKRVVTALYEEEDGLAGVWEGEPGEPVAVLKGHDNPIVSARFSPDGRKVATASMDGTARVWDTATGKQLLRLDAPTCGFSFAALSPDGTRVLTAHTGHVATFVREPGGGFGITSGRGGEGPRQDHAARIWDAETGKELTALKWPDAGIGGLGTPAFGPDGKRAPTAGRGGTWGGVSAGGPELPRVWDASNGKVLFQLKADVREDGRREPGHDAAFSPDGKL